MKVFNIQNNIGHAKYVVNYHNGEKLYPDGSQFYDISIFKNKKDLKKFTNDLILEGYVRE